ncbi:MAG: ECF transporter S component [Candidatus Bathyarchaeota archaeon]|nr:ECF transporter S component [Candidatus Bathyarchaeota archaeon]
MHSRFTTRQLSLLIVFSALGAIASVPIGHLGNYLKTIPILPFGTGQILAGLHLIMIILSALYIKKPGAATMTGAIKGLVEATLFSFHGITVIVMSTLQGAIIDLVLYVMGYSSTSILLGCGLSAASNVVFVQFFLGRPFPLSVYALMYALSFISGVVFGGYSGEKLYQMVKDRIS